MWEYKSTEELYHHGVKGMKWGVRKARAKSAELDQKKAAYKSAKKSYNKAFNKASNRAFAAYSPVKKHREANDKRWDDAFKKAEDATRLEIEYKTAKKEFKKNAPVGQKIKRGLKGSGKILSTAGKLYAADLVLNKGRGAKAVAAGAKYVKNAALDSMFNAAIVDSNGKVIKRYNM